MLRQVYAVFVFLLSTVLRAYRFRAPPLRRNGVLCRPCARKRSGAAGKKQIGIRLQYVEQA